MNHWNNLHRYRYLIIASAAILIATFGLVLIQYRSARRAEAQARQTLEANLDLHLLALVDEAKRDMLDHANHIFHSILQRRVRERDVPRLERAFTRAARRFPEIENMFVVFFEGQGENQTWRVLRYEQPDADNPNVTKFNGVPVGRLTENTATTEALRRAWSASPHQNVTHAITTFAPLDDVTAPQQIFFHIVYESDRLDRQENLDRVGLLAFTARADAYPARDYLPNLIARRAADETGALGKLDYAVTVNDAPNRKLIAGENLAEATRIRHFERADNLFPNLSFGIAAPALKTTDIEDFTRSSILLGLGATLLSLVGLALTWRATRREMRVAQLKSDFLASISHELKTPLTAIRAFGDLIHSGRARDAAKIREYGAIIKTESDRLTALINNILEMSRLERGLRRYRLEEGFLCATVAETVEVFRHTAGVGGYQVKVELPSLPIKAKFDENAIRQVLLNLLSNAVKYSGEKNDKQIIEVAVRQEKSEAVIEVRDFGIGIAPAEKRHIFKAFHRAPQSEVQTERGTGLGLAIVREIARAHGGEVSVESELGAGAVFRLHLPCLIDALEHPAAAILEINKDEEYLGYRRRT
jgi:signal transduction histidine kinase